MLAALTAASIGRAGTREVVLEWYGQSAFTLRSPAGTVALMDPVPDKMGFDMPRLEADVVTISHEHFDHTAVEKASGDPKVVRGLTADKARWNPIDTRVGDLRVRSVGTWHDAKRGASRGLNSVFVFETGGLRIAHLGDLGHPLTKAQLADIGSVDVVLIPVGGTFTIDAAGAKAVIRQLKPRSVVIPMHFKTARMSLDLPLATVEPFLKGMKRVRRVEGSKLVIDAANPPSGPEVVLLGLAPKG